MVSTNSTSCKTNIKRGAVEPTYSTSPQSSYTRMSDSKQLASNIKNMNPKDDELDRYQALLRRSDNSSTDNEDFKIAPLIWWDVKEHIDKSNNGSKSLRQYAVLGQETSPGLNKPYKPVLLNTDAPWSAFLCGSQGSGKSHTLSCMLENCLLDDAQIGKTLIRSQVWCCITMVRMVVECARLRIFVRK
jgi:hypothetical protein